MSELTPRTIQKETDNLVITCIDHRFQAIIRQLLMKRYGVDIERSDRLAYAGASKAVADSTLIPQIELSHSLHDIKKVWLVDHTDCGGFGGLKAFENDEHKEIESHFGSLSGAKEAIHNAVPELVVMGLVATLDGQLIQAPDPSHQ